MRDDLEALLAALDVGALAVRIPKHARQELLAYLDFGLLGGGDNRGWEGRILVFTRSFAEKRYEATITLLLLLSVALNAVLAAKLLTAREGPPARLPGGAKAMPLTGADMMGRLREHVQAKYPERMLAYYVDQAAYVEFGMTGTPQTIVVSPEGIVLKNWSGAYMETVGREARAYFGLPDLPMVQRATPSPAPAPTTAITSAPGHPKPTP